MDEIKAFRITELITGHLQNTLSEKDRKELEAWLKKDDNRRLFESVTNDKEREADLKIIRSFDAMAAYKRVMNRVERTPKPLYVRIARRYLPYAAAILLLTGISFLWQLRQKLDKAASTLATNKLNGAITPGQSRAVLILPNGTSISLGNKATYHNGTVHAGGGLLTYDPTHGHIDNVAYNTLITKAGMTYKVELEDGSQVWLNAGSSLTYPTTFNGKNRKVVLTGEAFFRVAHNKQAPFEVTANGVTVKDIGTEFNVRAYTDELTQRTTLISGAVKVGNGKTDKFLQPGQVAIADRTALTVAKADINIETGWQKGLFVFHQAPIKEVMKTIARWYDAQIVYAPGVKEDNDFTGEMPRNAPVSILLEKMALSGLASFTVSGHIITVHPYKE